MSTEEAKSAPTTVIDGNFATIINTAAALIHEENRAKGFWGKQRGFPEVIALIHSELSEALEADRKSLQDDKLPHRLGAEVELADALIRILDAAAGFNLDIGAAIVEKLAFNRSRPNMHGNNKY